MEKAVIYARYSSDRQTEQSIEGQVRECENFAKARKLTIINKYFDRAESGKSTVKRDRFNDMIKDSAKGLFQYVIVYQLDRFARNRYDSAHFKHILKKNGVKVLSAKENISDDPSGILMETVLEGMAEYYSAELAQKVKRGMYDGFLKGHASGSKCFGYDLIPADPSNPQRKTKKFVINKAESEIVKKIFDDYASGKTLKEIRNWLAVNGIKNKQGKIYHMNTITNIIKNPKYIGTLTFAGQSRENAIPAIVDKDTFAKAQERAKRNKKSPNSFKAQERYLLSTKTFCGYCKDTIAADSAQKPNGTIYRYYKCHTRKKSLAPCIQIKANKNELEFDIAKATHGFLQEKGIVEMIARQLVNYNDELQENPKLIMYEKQLAETEKAIANLLRAVEQGLFNTSTQQRMLQLESDKADIVWRIDGEKLDIPIKLDFLEVVFWLKQFADGDINNPEFRERLIDAFVNKIIMYNDKIIITYNIKGVDSEKVTKEQIITDFEVKEPNFLGSTRSRMVISPRLERGTTSLKVMCSTN